VFALKDKVSESLEKFFRNAKWLEKETGEMHD
jgi:NADH:ubiquinone oxidoreductase subunit C